MVARNAQTFQTTQRCRSADHMRLLCFRAFLILILKIQQNEINLFRKQKTAH